MGHCLLTLGAIAFAACKGGSPPAREWIVTETGVGPVRFGMTPADVATELGLPAPAPADPTCHYWTPATGPAGLSFMVENGRIARVDVDSARVPTRHGLEVGSPVAAVRSALGANLRDEPHKYRSDAGWRTLSVRSADSAFGIIFEVDSTAVRSYRAGRWPAVGYVERCG
jgi:hypothetical protein